MTKERVHRAVSKLDYQQNLPTIHLAQRSGNHSQQQEKAGMDFLINQGFCSS